MKNIEVSLKLNYHIDFIAMTTIIFNVKNQAKSLRMRVKKTTIHTKNCHVMYFFSTKAVFFNVI